MSEAFMITGPFVLGEVLKRRDRRIERNYRRWLKGSKIPHPNPKGPKALDRVFRPRRTPGDKLPV